MAPILAALRRLFSRPRPLPPDPEAAKAIRAANRLKFHHFKLLLTANGKALDIMAEIEKALAGRTLFGMTFVRSKCTAVGVNAFQMIRHLDQLAPDTYGGLYARFQDIQAGLDEVLAPARIERRGRLVAPLSEVDAGMADLVGSKMASLGDLARSLGLPVPPGFVVTAAGFDAFMAQDGLKEEIDRLLQAADVRSMDDRFRLSSAIQERIVHTPLPLALEADMAAAFAALEASTRPRVRVSVRSSALGEDAEGANYAGQFLSLLNIPGKSLVAAYREVVASMYGLPALNYRLSRGIRDEDAAMCVGVMAMVPARSGGVAYSRNPVNIRDDAVIVSAAFGLPKVVAEGRGPVDLFAVGRGDPPVIRIRRIADKTSMFACDPDADACQFRPGGEQRAEPSLSDAEVLELARMAVALEERFGAPQDIEWTVDEAGRVSLLQCRPLQRGEAVRQPFYDLAPARSRPTLADDGSTASPGVGCGRVCRVRDDSDALRFTPGAVLVVGRALPKWGSLIPYASALATEQGGLTGHLASIAREFSVPAVTGCARILETLEDGRMVTVDADAGRIYDGCVESLLEHAAPKPSYLQGSPVHTLLGQAARLITPLNLLDPDSPEFRIRHCRTLHDITRFCHEKAVLEMFNLSVPGEDSGASSKRLFDKVATQFWVVDLEDGFSQEPEDQWIRIEHIASIPMLALWEGITAIPWQGPPRVDAKGFMSIVAQAATNPNLVPAARGEYAERNYFIISRNFVNLQSRFGFHFCTVEAFVGDRPSQNYIVFRFQGGAADLARRRRRAQFITDILTGLGFTVRLNEDALSARLEGFETQAMKKRLKIVGYLTQHTRQLDMIMNDPAATAEHRDRILKDIETLRAMA
ncbi:MAG: PEP/pyruvate-binding domain-containing protein [Thermodesulfobacteriota bacterium]